MTEGKTLAEIFGLGSPIKAIKQLRDESGASVREAQAALKDADFDVEVALQLLKDRGQWETPERRMVQIAQHIEFLEEHKQSLREKVRGGYSLCGPRDREGKKDAANYSGATDSLLKRSEE